MKKIYLFISILFASFSGFSQSQPLDNLVVAVASHVPVMQIYDGIGSKFNGVKFSYKNDENLASLKNWIAKYPDEVSKYKTAVENMIANTNPAILSDVDLKMFDGFQAQCEMLKLIAK